MNHAAPAVDGKTFETVALGFQSTNRQLDFVESFGENFLPVERLPVSAKNNPTSRSSEKSRIENKIDWLRKMSRAGCV
jgi:hypothetical protein